MLATFKASLVSLTPAFPFRRGFSVVPSMVSSPNAHSPSLPDQYKSPPSYASSQTSSFNPVQSLDNARVNIEKVLQLNDVPTSKFGLRLETWGGPLQGVIHPFGQLSWLNQGKGSPTPPLTAKQLDSMRACLAAVCSARDVLLPQTEADRCLFSCMATESDFEVHPILVELPSHSSTTSEVDTATIATALGVDPDLLKMFSEPVIMDTAADFLEWFETDLLKLKASHSGSVDPDRAKLLEAARIIFTNAVTQGPYIQLVLGGEGLFNPIPVMWLAPTSSSRRVLVGLMSAVVWT